MSNAILLAAVDRLIAEGEAVSDTRRTLQRVKSEVVDGSAFAKWLLGCKHFVQLLGSHGRAWAEPFEVTVAMNALVIVNRMQAALLGIKETIEHGLLLSVEDLVLAEAFSNLLEQAKYLASEGYFLAAGVIGRAVLEEHLRTWCQHANCLPTRSKPVLNDYTQELYKAKQFNVSVLKHVEAMTAIGNSAAHNKPELNAPDVDRLLRDLGEFLARYPLASSIK